MDRNDLPLGFGFALVQNPDAMQRFLNFPEAKQGEILQKAQGVSSREEMQSLVDGLSVSEDKRDAF